MRIVNPMWRSEGLDCKAYGIVREGSFFVLGRTFKQAIDGKWFCSINKEISSARHTKILDSEKEAVQYVETKIKELAEVL